MQRPIAPDASALDLALLREIEDAAHRAAAFIRAQDARRADLTWDIKGDSDFVSVVDRGAEALIRDALAPAGRDVTFIGEESAPDTPIGVGTTFIVDPLDGTTNYLHGFPAYAVSIGALVDGALAAAVVIDVPRSETFTAVRNGGAWVTVETVGPTGPEASGGWFRHTFRVASIVTPTANVRLRFVAADLGAGSVVEAAIDDLEVFELCPGSCGGVTTYCVATANSNQRS